MTKDKLSFILGIHCHQPVGNFGWVIEEAFEKSYKPFLDEISKYPSLKLTAHFSGCLLEWIEEFRPEYIAQLKELVIAGQAEIIGSGFYEPILMTISEADRIEQIQIMKQYVSQKLGMTPDGAWLTERIWEPSLPKTLHNAGVRYTFVDDTHFMQAGVQADKIGGYYLSEEEAKSVAVFPIDQNLRYAVPFKDPQATIDYLKSRYDMGDRSCCTLIDDGEKFGVWPGTYELLYSKEMWLKRFFELLSEQSSWLEITTPKEYLAKNKAEGLVYLPTSSYFEMGQWTLNAADNNMLVDLKHRLEPELEAKTEVFLRGGYFRNFFSRYKESNHMQKRMLEVSELVRNSGLKGDELTQAKREIFMAQCNCAYWHGIFGGLYLPHLRDAIYEHIIKAEKLADKKDLAVFAKDINIDGLDEIYLKNKKLTAIISPDDGGSLIELDLRDFSANVINTLARRFEAYHVSNSEEDSENTGNIHDSARPLTNAEKDLLVYDKTSRSSFRDSIFAANVDFSPEDLQNLKYDDLANLAELSYAAHIEEQQDQASVVLESSFSVDGDMFSISKTFSLNKDSNALNVDYNVINNSDNLFSGYLGVNLNLSTPSALGIENAFAVDNTILENWPLQKCGKQEHADSFRLRDPHRGFDMIVSLSQKANMFWHPVNTLSQSESGFEKNYQASSLWLLIKIDLPANMNCGFKIVLEATEF